jgi:hypothetical protein
MNCEAQCSCFTLKTGLVMVCQSIHKLSFMLIIFVFSESRGNVLTDHICVSGIIVVRNFMKLIVSFVISKTWGA